MRARFPFVVHFITLLCFAAAGEAAPTPPGSSGINWLSPGDPSRLGPAVPIDVPQALLPRILRPLRLWIDPGHGGHDDGAQGFHGVSEKSLALELGFLVRDSIRIHARRLRLPVEVRLTRERDEFVPLAARVAAANEWEADLFMSLHGNAIRGAEPSGFEVYFLSAEATDAQASKLADAENRGEERPIRGGVLSILRDLHRTQHVAESSRFAEAIFTALSREAKPNGRGVRQGPFAVLSGTEMPAVLVEVGYVTTPEDALRLSQPTYRFRIAQAIALGMLEFAQALRHLG